MIYVRLLVESGADEVQLVNVSKFALPHTDIPGASFQLFLGGPKFF